MKRFEIKVPMTFGEDKRDLLFLPEGSDVLLTSYEWFNKRLVMLVEMKSGKPVTRHPDVYIKSIQRVDRPAIPSVAEMLKEYGQDRVYEAARAFLYGTK